MELLGTDDVLQLDLRLIDNALKFALDSSELKHGTIWDRWCTEIRRGKTDGLGQLGCK